MRLIFLCDAEKAGGAGAPAIVLRWKSFEPEVCKKPWRRNPFCGSDSHLDYPKAREIYQNDQKVHRCTLDSLPLYSYFLTRINVFNKKRGTLNIFQRHPKNQSRV